MPLSNPDDLRKRYKKSFEIQEKLHELVPGGSHTYSKGEDAAPYLCPKIMSHAKGAMTWDVDGNEYIDWMMGNRTFVLGHAYDAVDDAVKKALSNGTNFSKPGYLEYELAEYLTELWPVAEMVKFGKNGSDVTHAAVKLARAYTGRDYIVKCGDHPFFSTHDWFMSAMPCNNGTPEAVQKLTLDFRYNDLPSLERLFAEYPEQIACVILEPVKDVEPKEGFLEGLKDLCEKNGALLIFDEMIAGMRFDLRGAHHRWGVYPHLACFGKAISNGYSCSVLAGKREIMELGGLHHDRKRTFLLSQTHSSETVGLAAALATLKECDRLDVSGHIWKYGKRFKDSVNAIAQAEGLGDCIQVTGFDCNPNLSFKTPDGKVSPELATLFVQECAAQGILMSWLTFTWSHTDAHMERTLGVVQDVMRSLKEVIDTDLSTILVGDPIKPVMRTYNKCRQRFCGRIFDDASKAVCCKD